MSCRRVAERTEVYATDDRVVTDETRGEFLAVRLDFKVSGGQPDQIPELLYGTKLASAALLPVVFQADSDNQGLSLDPSCFSEMDTQLERGDLHFSLLVSKNGWLEAVVSLQE